MTCGVYVIRDDASHAVYIGVSVQIERRLKEHAAYRRAAGRSDNVSCAVLEATLPDETVMDAAERRWLTHFRDQGWIVRNAAHSVSYAIWSAKAKAKAKAYAAA